jgi:hypothetical protein
MYNGRSNGIAEQGLDGEFGDGRGGTWCCPDSEQRELHRAELELDSKQMRGRIL